MVAAVESHTWVGLVAPILLVLSSCAAGCIVPETDTFLINDLENMKDRHCHRCYQAPLPHQLQVRLQRVRLRGLSSIMIYMDGTSHIISQDCGECEGEREACGECEEVVLGKVFELYVRQDKDLDLAEGENVCQQIASFNISLTIISKEPEIEAPPDCEDGFLMTFPQAADSCIINTTVLSTETRCLVPTCADDITSSVVTSDGLVERTEVEIKRMSAPETCVWQLNTEQRKHLTLTASKDIRPHLTVFEESLMNPKWDMEWCPTYGNDYELDTDTDTVFVVYHNTNPQTKTGTLSMVTQTDLSLCLLPPNVDHGSVEFKRLESATVALYSCDPGYSLFGPAELKCKRGAWDEPPLCLHNSKAAGGQETTAHIKGEAESIKEEADDNLEAQLKEEVAREEETHTSSSSSEWDDLSNNNTLGDYSLLQPSLNNTEESMCGICVLIDGLDDEMKLYIIIGAVGLLGLVIIIIIVTVVVYRKRYPSMRLGLGRRFDTFQNPIYEKAVVRMPMQEEEPETEGKKGDPEEISDCTVLEP